MGCGCGKPMRNTTRSATIGPIRQTSTRPISQNISIQGIGEGLAQSSANTPPQMVGMDEERRRIEKLRRDAIKKALNK